VRLDIGLHAPQSPPQSPSQSPGRTLRTRCQRHVRTVARDLLGGEPPHPGGDPLQHRSGTSPQHAIPHKRRHPINTSSQHVIPTRHPNTSSQHVISTRYPNTSSQHVIPTRHLNCASQRSIVDPHTPCWPRPRSHSPRVTPALTHSPTPPLAPADAACPHLMVTMDQAGTHTLMPASPSHSPTHARTPSPSHPPPPTRMHSDVCIQTYAFRRMHSDVCIHTF
jgi:hypothetical protein